MQKFKIPSLLLLVAAFFYFSSFTGSEFQNTDKKRIVQPEREFKAEYVVVFIIDGPRYSETYGDSGRVNIPYMNTQLLPQAAFVDNFRNNGSTFTIAGHAAISTGRYHRLSNDGTQLPKYPSMFQQFLAQKNLPAEQAWIIASKGKLNVIGQTRDKKWKDKHLPMTYCGPGGNNAGYGYDAETYEKSIEILKKHHPKLVLINMLDVDSWAHANNWERYIKGIRDTDKLAYDMWNFIQSDSVYKDKTAMFITNDHGRHLDGVKNGFVSHGGGCEGCRRMTLIALGPDFKQNYLCTKQYEQIDISATIAKILEFEVPHSKGKFMSDLFIGTD